MTKSWEWDWNKFLRGTMSTSRRSKPLAHPPALLQLSNMDFTKLTVVKLKKELARRGAKASGRKLDFIQWLEAYVQNQDFWGQAIEIPDVNPMPDWPDVSEFHSLALDMMYLAPKKKICCIMSFTVKEMTNYQMKIGTQSAKDWGWRRKIVSKHWAYSKGMIKSKPSSLGWLLRKWRN